MPLANLSASKSQQNNKVAITSGGEDIGFALIKSILKNRFTVSLLIRNNPNVQTEHKKLMSYIDIINGTALEIGSINNLLSNCSNLIHAEEISDFKSTNSEQVANALAVNGFYTGLLTFIIQKTYAGKVRLLYLSSRDVYKIPNRPDILLWINNAVSSFYEFLSDTGLSENLSHSILNFTRSFLTNSPLPAGVAVYPISKYIGEQFVSQLENSTILRLANMYGPGCTRDKLISVLIRNRLLGDVIEIVNEKRDYVYMDDVNDAIITLLLKQDIRNIRVCDDFNPNVVETRELVGMIDNMIPTAYGLISLREENAANMMLMPLAVLGEIDIEEVIRRPKKNFKNGLSETIRFIRSTTESELLLRKDPTTFVFDSERLLKKLRGGSTSHLFLLQNRLGKRYVRKIAVRKGIEGNGSPKLRSEINYLEYISEKSEFAELSDAYLAPIQKFDVDNIVYFDMPFVESENVATLLSTDKHLQISDFYAAIKQLFKTISKINSNTSEHLEFDLSLETLDSLYLKRAECRIDTLLSNTYKPDIPNLTQKSLTKILSSPEIIVNGTICSNPLILLAKISNNSYFKEIIRPRHVSFCTHGDLTLLNMLIDKCNNKIFLIDPRGFIGNWDPLYDLGKIKFSLSGFFGLKKRKVSVTYYRESIFSFHFTDNLSSTGKLDLINSNFLAFLESKDIFEALKKEEPYWKERVLFAEAINYLADIPYLLHTNRSVKLALASYLIGAMLLNDITKEICSGYKVPRFE